MTVDIPARTPAPPTQWGRNRGSIYPISSYRPPTRHTMVLIGGMALPPSMWITGSVLFAVVVAVCVVAAAIAVHYVVGAARRHLAVAASGLYSVDSVVDGADAVVFHDIALATVTVVWAVELDSENPHDGPRPEWDWAPLCAELLAAASAQTLAVDVQTRDWETQGRRVEQHTTAKVVDGSPLGAVADWVPDVLGNAHRTHLALAGPLKASHAYLATTWRDGTPDELSDAVAVISAAARYFGVAMWPLTSGEAYRPPISWRCC